MDYCDTNEKKVRWEHIDFIEATAIFFVLLYHSTKYTYDCWDGAPVLDYVRYYLRTILSTCVPLLFFANGYLLLNRKFDLKKHLVKCIRLVILTVVWGMITILAFMWMRQGCISLTDAFGYLWRLELWWAHHLWYMGALVCIYTLLPILKISFDHCPKYFIYFTVIAAMFTFGNTFLNIMASLVLGRVIEINWFHMFNPFREIYGYAFVYFCLGGLAHRYENKILVIPKAKRNAGAALVILCSTVILFMIGVQLTKISGTRISDEIWDVVWKGYDTVPTLLNVLAIYVISLSCKKSSVIRYISCNTLGIYFIHVMLLQFFDTYIRWDFPVIDTFAGNIVFSVALLMTCLAIVTIIKKIPLVKELLKI